MKLWISLRRIWSSPQPLKHIGEAERVGPYIFNSNEFRSSDLTIRPKAFEPAKKSKNKSIFRLDGLALGQIKRLGWLYVGLFRNKRPYGHARLLVGMIHEQGLKVTPDIKQHPRHALIDNWPQLKAHRISLMLQLAMNSELVKYENRNS